LIGGNFFFDCNHNSASLLRSRLFPTRCASLHGNLSSTFGTEGTCTGRTTKQAAFSGRFFAFVRFDRLRERGLDCSECTHIQVHSKGPLVGRLT
jgi:hypothetical protein